jgi:hypothetical protein
MKFEFGNTGEGGASVAMVHSQFREEADSGGTFILAGGQRVSVSEYTGPQGKDVTLRVCR